jgi:hypothetical protein
MRASAIGPAGEARFANGPCAEGRNGGKRAADAGLKGCPRGDLNVISIAFPQFAIGAGLRSTPSGARSVVLRAFPGFRPRRRTPLWAIFVHPSGMSRSGRPGRKLSIRAWCVKKPIHAIAAARAFPLYIDCKNGLSSGQRRPHAHARRPRIAHDAGPQALVAEPRAEHLPAEAPARAAHPHST